MKRKGLILAFVLMFTTLFSVGLYGCGNKHKPKEEWMHNDEYHWQECQECDEEKFNYGLHQLENGATEKVCSICKAKFAYTEEENFAVWASGRDASKAYEGDYTFRYLGQGYKNGELVTTSKTFESNSDLKYYSREIMFDINDAGEEVVSTDETIIVKTVLDNGVTRTKLVKKKLAGDTTSVTAKYVNKYYASKLVEFNPGDIAGNYIVGTQTDLEAWKNNISAVISAMAENEKATIESWDAKITRNADGKVLAQCLASYTYQDDARKSDEDYLNSLHKMTYSIVVSGGYVVEVSDDETDMAYYKDSTKNIVKREVDKSEYLYQFDNEYYDSFSMGTNQTEEACYADVKFVFNGRGGSDLKSVKVGTSFAEADAFAYINDTFDGVNASDFATFYTDAEMTQKFTSNYVFDEGLTIYVKLTAPEGRGIVLTVDVSEKEERIVWIKVVNLETKFFYDADFSSYKVLTFEGTPLEPDSTGFVCSASTVYVIECVPKSA